MRKERQKKRQKGKERDGKKERIGNNGMRKRRKEMEIRGE